MPWTGSARCLIPTAWSWSTPGNIKINSDETRAALEYLKKLMAVNPPEVYAWDDAGNNR